MNDKGRDSEAPKFNHAYALTVQACELMRVIGDLKEAKEPMEETLQKICALRYTHDRAPAADEKKACRLVRLRSSHGKNSDNNNTRGDAMKTAKANVVEVEFENKNMNEGEQIRYRGVSNKNDAKNNMNERESAVDDVIKATVKSRENNKNNNKNNNTDDDNENDESVECAILFDGEKIELRVLDETIAGLRVQRKLEDESVIQTTKRLVDVDVDAIKNKGKRTKTTTCM